MAGMTRRKTPEWEVRLWHLADVLLTSLYVRFRGQSRHLSPLVSMSANDPKRTYGTDASAKRMFAGLTATTQPTRSIRTRNRCVWRGDDAPE